MSGGGGAVLKSTEHALVAVSGGGATDTIDVRTLSPRARIPIPSYLWVSRVYHCTWARDRRRVGLKAGRSRRATSLKLG